MLSHVPHGQEAIPGIVCSRSPRNGSRPEQTKRHHGDSVVTPVGLGTRGDDHKVENIVPKVFA